MAFAAHRLVRPAFVAVAVTGALAGCAAEEVVALAPIAPAAAPRREAAPARRAARLEAGPQPPMRVLLGGSVRGRPIEATVFEGGGGCVLILGGIHGDEPVSSALVGRLADHLEARPEARFGKRVVLIPRANPDGLAAATRWNANGVDLNRNFPTGNFTAGRRHGAAPLSEPESRALAGAIARYAPSCVVSVHGPLECIDADGGAASRALAQRMASVSPLPLNDLPELSGSLGTYAGSELRLKMITYELDRSNPPTRRGDDYFAPHLRALLVAVQEG